MIRAVLFDLAGTLVKIPGSLPDLKEEILIALMRLGFPLSFFSKEDDLPSMLEKLEAYVRASGMSSEDKSKVWEEVQKSIEEFERSILERAVLVPGALEVLAALRERGLKIGLVSFMSSAVTVNLLRRMGLDRFMDTVVARDFLSDPRPNSAHMLKALEDLGVRPEEAVLVSCSASMVRYAKEINMHAIGITPGCGGELSRAGVDRLIRSLADLSAAISELGGER